MIQDEVKRLEVKFSNGLPMGTHGRFKHNGQMWVAYPAGKYAQIMTVIDRLIGIHDGITMKMTQWLNSHPDDADRVMMILESVSRAHKLRDSLVEEKIKGQTQ